MSKIIDGKHSRINSTDSEAFQADGIPPRPNIRGRRKALTAAKDIVLASLALVGLIVGTFGMLHRHQHDEKISQDAATGHGLARESCYCGNSTAEARQRGCKYYSLSAAWLPDHCRDDELTAEFERLGDGPDGNWLYWADKNHTQPLTIEQVAELGDDPSATFHMSGKWHVTHCFFLWRLEHRSRFNGKFVEGRFDSEKHILHCMKVAGQHLQIGTMSGVSLDADT